MSMSQLFKQAKIIVETLDEFTPDMLDKESEIKELERLKDNEIARGGVGVVYTMKPPAQDYVLKIQDICRESDSINLRSLCNMAQKGDLIFKIPNTLINKTTLLAPNYISESLIQTLMTELVLKNYSPTFPKTLGTVYDRTNRKVYTVIEKLSDLTNHIQTRNDIWYLFFSIFYGLMIGQQVGRFVHNDMRVGNIMARSTLLPTITEYPLKKGYLYVYSNYTPIIADFGHSRFEFKQYIITPKLVFTVGGREIANYYYFNPFIDQFSFWGALFTQNYYTRYEKSNKQDWIDIGSLIFQFMVGQKLSFEEIGKTFPYIYYQQGHQWRPDITRAMFLDFPKLNIKNFREPSQLIELLVPEMIKNNPQFTGNVSEYLEKYKFLYSPNKLNINNILTLRQPDYKYIPFDRYLISSPSKTSYTIVDKGIDIATYTPDSFKDVLDKHFDPIVYEYRRTKGKIEQSKCLANVQYMTIVRITSKFPSEYKFRFDCCRIDMRDYFQNNILSSGVVINGAFFDIKGNFFPIGNFKWRNFRSNNKIPSLYHNFYRAITLKNNKLDIQKLATSNDEIAKYEGYMEIGPVLVEENKVVITTKVLRNYYTYKNINVFPFQCEVSEKKDKLLSPIDNKSRLKHEDECLVRDERKFYPSPSTVFNCDLINPGELSHGSNPNPRSAMFITNDGTIGFVYVEGRDERGEGVDLHQLAQICLLYGANVAINLDGGRSSSIMWKEKDSKTIESSNPTHAFTYPVGSVISLVKKK